jgi:hypothetical protein
MPCTKFIEGMREKFLFGSQTIFVHSRQWLTRFCASSCPRSRENCRRTRLRCRQTTGRANEPHVSPCTGGRPARADPQPSTFTIAVRVLDLTSTRVVIRAQLVDTVRRLAAKISLAISVSAAKLQLVRYRDVLSDS